MLIFEKDSTISYTIPSFLIKTNSLHLLYLFVCLFYFFIFFFFCKKNFPNFPYSFSSWPSVNAGRAPDQTSKSSSCLIFSATSKNKQYRFTHKTRLQLDPVVRIAYILVSLVPLSQKHLEQWRQIGSVFFLCLLYQQQVICFVKLIFRGDGSGLRICCSAHPDAALIEDYRAGDQICSECGLVVGDRLVTEISFRLNCLD